MATLLPNAVQQFIDANGAPLAGGFVYFYIPNTFTPKDTWSDSSGSTLNTNPIELNASGENPAGSIYGSGSYRQIVTDADGNQIWDRLTADTAIGGLAWGGASTGTANAQVIAASSFSQQDGQEIAFIAGFANSGALTVSPGGGSPIPVLKDSVDGPTPLIGGEVGVGNAVSMIYDATRGAFHIENTSINGSAPAPDSAALAATSTAVYLTPANLALERSLFGLGIPMINGVLTSSVAANAVTFSLAGLDGNAPSAADPVYVAFRNSTATDGNYAVRTITSATTITVPSGATLAASNGVPFRIWIVAVDTGSGIQLGVVNAVSGTSVMPLRDNILVSTTATPASAAQVIYTTSSLSGAPMRLLGYFDWGSGLAAAGTWGINATYKQLWGPGVPKPGDVVQIVRLDTGAVATGTTSIPQDDSIPQITEGDQYMSQAIIPTAAPNLLSVLSTGSYAFSTAGTEISALFRDSTANALRAVSNSISGSNAIIAPQVLSYVGQAGAVTSTTFRVRAGGTAIGTTTFNGQATGRLFGGVYNSFLQIQEIMG